MKANIFDIKRFAVHDGDGIRTTVFFKGCPLKCVWCHNPEGIASKFQTAFFSEKCIGCGECVSACPFGAHKLIKNGHIFERELCVSCGRCETVCRGEALRLYGREMDIDEVMSVLVKDRLFYNSGGGITLSGGECLLQSDFCAELLKSCKEEGFNTAVDTCGYVKRESIEKVIPFTDTFLYDIKAIDGDVHIRCTGVSNELILSNLAYLDSQNKAIEVRIPYVPECNADQPEKIADFLKQFKNIKRIKILPYHNFAASKYAALGLENTLPAKLPDETEISAAQKILL